MVNYVSDYRALLSGNYWWGDKPVGKPTIITYSFETSAYDYLNTSTYSDAFRKSFKPLTAAQKATTLAALKQFDDASGLKFIEVAAGQGDMRFANYDLSKDPTQSTAAGYAYFPGVTIGADWSHINDNGGDVFLDDSTIGYNAADLLHVILHEVGHGLGLKHPFEGDVRLDPKVDNTKQTVMSYTGYDPKLGPIDIAALQHLYGAPTSDGQHVASWSWNAATATMTQTGGNGADTIRGVTTADIMRGMGGDDVLAGGSGKDRLEGGADRDALFGGAGDDALDGGDGDDKLDGGAGNDRLDGGAGNDTIEGHDGTNTAFGGAGNDALHGGRHIDHLDGGADDDTVAGWDGADVLAGGAGRDNLFGGNNDDRVSGGGGDDTMNGDAGHDTLLGDAGKDNLFGLAGNDTLIGGAGDDWLSGGADVDTVSYSAATRALVVSLVDVGEAVNGTWIWYNAKGAEIGYDRMAEVENVVGGLAADSITGNGAANLLDGRGGADRLAGGAGNDVYLVDNAGDRVAEAKGQGVDTVRTTVSYSLIAGQEIDRLEFAKGVSGANLVLKGNEFGQTLLGTASANTLDGGLGADRLAGEGGADTFAFTTRLGGGNVDHIIDFASVDTINLAKGIFGGLTSGALTGAAFKNLSVARADADDRILYKQATGELFYDADAGGKGAAVLFAVLDNRAALTAADFFIV